ncbi:MAG: serine/threonine-protein kinase, partial [Anaerolineae bacterium]|nr:serine/threonine-protein kinase [Anaerolineae bacterium]
MDLTGQKIDKYELIESLGQGGMAEVYKAYQPGLERFVAIKLMHRHLASSADFIDRFKREARSIGQLQHPHIMQVIDFDVADSIYYLVMGYIQGETLSDYLEKQGAIPVNQALSIAGQLADAVDYAHGYGMIHRDIKPGNIMFRDDTHTHAILTDFGMARLVDQAKLTLSGTLVGTPAYMSPEASRGEPVDERGDVYSLGVVLYEMLTGTTPYTGDTAVAIIVKQATQPLPPPREIFPGIPEPVEYVVMKALEKDPADRFQSAADFRDALERVQVVARGDMPTLIEPLDQYDDDDDDATILTVQRPVSVAAPAIPQPPPMPQTPPAPATPSPSALRWILPVGIGVSLLAVLFLVALSFLLGSRQQDPVANEPGQQVENGQNEGAIAVSLDGPQPSGFLRFTDNDTSRAGDFSIQLSGVTSPPAGSHYELWLTDDTGTEVLNLIGQIAVTNDRIDQQGSTDQNLIGRFSQAIISLEADGDADGQISEQIVFQGSL